MASYFGIDTADTSSFFSNAFPSTTSSSGSSALSDLSMIQNGTYRKLLNAYYKKEDKTPEQTAAEKAEKISLVTAKTSAESLNDSVKKLMDTGFTADNTEQVRSTMKDFVEKYNAMLDAGSSVDTKSVLRSTLWMTQSTAVNAGLLSDVGISIGKDNKLSLDETKLQNADTSKLKTLFTGRGSYADRILQKTSAISSAAVNKVADGKSATAYTSSGSDFTQLSTGTLYDSLKQK